VGLVLDSTLKQPRVPLQEHPFSISANPHSDSRLRWAWELSQERVEVGYFKGFFVYRHQALSGV
jgi:hypothetical protein